MNKLSPLLRAAALGDLAWVLGLELVGQSPAHLQTVRLAMFWLEV